jgi:hypothetical protein
VSSVPFGACGGKKIQDNVKSKKSARQLSSVLIFVYLPKEKVGFPNMNSVVLFIPYKKKEIQKQKIIHQKNG